MSAENQPVFENAEGIAYDESGGVTISAPLMRVVGRTTEPTDTPEAPVFDAATIAPGFLDEDESVYATLTSDGRYVGNLSREEYESLPTYYRRGVSQNGLYSLVIHSGDDAI